jgi:hypothetical protein
VGKGSWLAEQVLGMDLSAQLGQEPHPRGHVPIGQEARADLFVGCFAEPSPAFGIGEHVGDRTAETEQVASDGGQASAHAVLDLDSVSADVARYDRASIPASSQRDVLWTVGWRGHRMLDSGGDPR